MLAKALDRKEARVRHGAIRGLSRLRTDAAMEVLRAAAEGHADAATRRRAKAALRKGGERGGERL
jgi:HEAT repeat protein